MIVSRTPFRISLLGGGSDLREYYRTRPGFVVSTAISRYMYVTVNRRFDETIRASYTTTEIVERLDDLHHVLIRECMRMTGVTSGVEVTTIADVPAGAGLGSSSSLTVGLLNALYVFQGHQPSPEELARRACEVEINIVKKPIGKQDQYISAFGGFRSIEFLDDETVEVRPIECSARTRRELVNNLLLFYTGTTRDSTVVLSEARMRIMGDQTTRAALDRLVDLAHDLRSKLTAGRLDTVGALLHAGWTFKKRMASTVSNGRLERLYQCAISAGAEGGKVVGAGGGGCLLFYVPGPAQARVREEMSQHGLREIRFQSENSGSRIIYAERPPFRMARRAAPRTAIGTPRRARGH